jgi:glycosyltransferase involved in cell wall biosynthesis
MANCARSSRLFKGRRVEVIPTGVDTEMFHQCNKVFAREMLGVPKDSFVILFGCVKIDDDRKGGKQFLEAINVLKNLIQHRNGTILTFGTSPSDFGSQFGIRQINLGKILDERLMPIVYSCADTFVAPSLYDNLPNTVIEAMSCSTAVVSCWTGGIPDVITDGLNGLLSKPGDSHSLSQALKTIIEDNVLRDQIANNARLKIKNDLTLRITAQRYNDLYLDIIQNYK